MILKVGLVLLKSSYTIVTKFLFTKPFIISITSYRIFTFLSSVPLSGWWEILINILPELEKYVAGQNLMVF